MTGTDIGSKVKETLPSHGSLGLSGTEGVGRPPDRRFDGGSLRDGPGTLGATDGLCTGWSPRSPFYNSWSENMDPASRGVVGVCGPYSYPF